MKASLYILTECRRLVVLEAIQEVCRYRGWGLLAAHVRQTHVHVVVGAEETPERAMNDLKAYSSRALNRIEARQRRWTEHGSTKCLCTGAAIEAAVRYVVARQGESMAVYLAPGR